MLFITSSTLLLALCGGEAQSFLHLAKEVVVEGRLGRFDSTVTAMELEELEMTPCSW